MAFDPNKVYKLQYKDGSTWKDVKLGSDNTKQIMEFLTATNFSLDEETNELVITFNYNGQTITRTIPTTPKGSN